MDSETEQDHSTPKLPLFFSIQSSPEHPSGTVTPPLFTLASVPFTWEEHPGKPRPCTTLITLPTTTTTTTTLEPPPRLYTDTTKLAKTPSPNTVLDGPYITNRHKFTSSSFSIFRERKRQPSFDSSNGSKSPERGPLLTINGKKKHKRKGLFFPAWVQRNSKNGKKEETISSGCMSSRSFVFPSSSMDATSAGFGFGSDDTIFTSLQDHSRIPRNGSFSKFSHPKPHFWASVYEGFKQVMPWKSRKPRKEGLSVV